MGRRGKGNAEEPMTDGGKPFGQMSGEEKAKEFDASIANPGGYAARNFGNDNRSQGKGKHSK